MSGGEILDTPEKMAAGFRRSVTEMQAEGKIKDHRVNDFLNTAMQIADAMAASPAALGPSRDVILGMMTKVTIMAVATAGLADGVICFVADKSKLN